MVAASERLQIWLHTLGVARFALSRIISVNPILKGAVIFLVTFSIFLARRPDIISNAQFWAEDGSKWYADAYNFGALHALLIPHTAYLQTFSRTIFGIGLLFDLEYVPLWANIVALACRAVVPLFFFSSRFFWVDWRVRIATGIYFCMMPNLAEVHANITNTQTYFGLYLFLLILADRPASRSALTHDLIAMVFCGLSCPIIVFIVPCWLLREYAYLRAETMTLRGLLSKLITPFSLVLLATASIQVITYVFTIELGRYHVPTGATPGLLVQILTSRIFLGFVLPDEWLPVTTMQSVSWAVFVTAAGIIVATVIRGDWRARCLVLFPALVLAATLKNPIISEIGPTWPIFLAGGGQRYFVMPSLCWFGILLQFSGLHLPRMKPGPFSAAIATMILILLPSFRISPLPDSRFSSGVERFKAAASGQRVSIPIQPAGWSMVLIKK